jgi:UPF0755 protein
VADARERTEEEREAARRSRELARGERTEARREDGAAGGGPPRRAAPRRRARAGGPRRPVGRAARAHSRAGRVAALVALLLAAAVTWFLVELFQPFAGPGHGSITVTIPPRSSAGEIGSLLERDGVIDSSFFFELRVALAGDRGKLYAGTYHLRLDMSYGAVLAALTTLPPAAKVTTVTIVPGETRRQIAALLRSQGVKGNYLAATRRSPLLNPAAYGAPRSTPSLEGFLFPDTYRLRAPVSISALVTDQLTQFKREFATVDLSYARRQHLTPYDVLIIASIVEKEAATARDRPLVASVIYNRLRDHMPLGMDSTTRYEFNDYDKPLTAAQLSSPSPYNTRLHVGLPPTPISNPGLAAIEAAAHPARTSYLYFVVKPCGNGESVFEANYAQFLRDEARYQQARARRGGRSPVRC